MLENLGMTLVPHPRELTKFQIDYLALRKATKEDINRINKKGSDNPLMISAYDTDEQMSQKITNIFNMFKNN